METFLSCLAFTAFLIAQVAAVIAIHAERKDRQSDTLAAPRRERRSRLVQASGN